MGPATYEIISRSIFRIDRSNTVKVSHFVQFQQKIGFCWLIIITDTVSHYQWFCLYFNRIIQKNGFGRKFGKLSISMTNINLEKIYIRGRAAFYSRSAHIISHIVQIMKICKLYSTLFATTPYSKKKKKKSKWEWGESINHDFNYEYTKNQVHAFKLLTHYIIL